MNLANRICRHSRVVLKRRGLLAAAAACAVAPKALLAAPAQQLFFGMDFGGESQAVLLWWSDQKLWHAYECSTTKDGHLWVRIPSYASDVEIKEFCEYIIEQTPREQKVYVEYAS